MRPLLSLLMAAFGATAALAVSPASAHMAQPGSVKALTSYSDTTVEQIRWRGRHHHRHHGLGIGLGFATGAIIGSALAPRPYYYGGPYAYSPGYRVDADDAYCSQRFRSYDPASGTYLGYDGQRHPCP
jgi:hypothetical protein